MKQALAWWQRGVIYEAYVRSITDGNGDGIGDLAGLRGRLDYLEWLGVDALWITPIYPSPMVDLGYDVADYTDVDPLFGDLTEFDRLLADAHRRSLKVILDLVPNHTSDQHPWFQASRSSADAAKRDWYIWRDPAPEGGPPNNWLSEFGGPAWELDERTGQYYYHAFSPEQPDLNWRHPDVRAAIYDVMRFWLRRGVDGFRVDVMWHLIKDARFRDNPPNPEYHEGEGSPYQRLIPAYSVDQPEVHEVVAEMRSVVDEYEDRVLIGEIYLPINRLVEYYGAEGRGAHLPFNFHLITTPWEAAKIRVVIDRYEGALPASAWPNWVLGNHDKPRVASRVGSEQARVAAVMLLTLRGTPTLYYGDELGLVDVDMPDERAMDVRETSMPGRGLGRDPFRTPMPWQAGDGAGFSSGRPWLPIGEDNITRNVETERNDPGSMLALHRRLLQLRRREPALVEGSYAPVEADGPVVAYRRCLGDRQLLVACNLGDEVACLDLPEDGNRVRVLLSARGGTDGEVHAGSVQLRPNDAVVTEPA